MSLEDRWADSDLTTSDGSFVLQTVATTLGLMVNQADHSTSGVAGGEQVDIRAMPQLRPTGRLGRWHRRSGGQVQAPLGRSWSTAKEKAPRKEALSRSRSVGAEMDR
jgi:hypothetical protein